MSVFGSVVTILAAIVSALALAMPIVVPILVVRALLKRARANEAKQREALPDGAHYA